MKTSSLFLTAVTLVSFLGRPTSLPAASFTEAEFTRLENDVKVLKENSAPHPAAVGENVTAVSSVATGVNSRAELRFPDKSLTRLGANSRFTIRGEARTLDLDKGVMMLQVPKKMGGAKVRTAAVTAAVTGTTAMFEYLPNGYIKLIVIEGTVDLFSNKKPNNFQEVHAGQMIIMDPNSTTVPPPVDVDLKRLLRTSKLLSQYENLPNTNYVNQAVLNQQNLIKDGTLLDTSLVIPGLGTVVSIVGNDAHALDGNITVQNAPTRPTPPNNPGNNNNNNNNSNNPPPPPNNPPPPGFQGFLPLISGTTVLNSTSTVVPDPTVTAYNSNTGGPLTSQGLIYRGRGQDGTVQYFAFGSNAPLDGDVQRFMNSSLAGFGSFRFEDLYVNGTPVFSIPSSESLHVTDVLFASDNSITLSSNVPFLGAGGPDGGSEGIGALNLYTTNLTGLALIAQKGNITLDGNFSINGEGQDLVLATQSLSSDVILNGNINLDPGNLIVSAGRDAVVKGQVNASQVTINSRRDTVVDGGRISSYAGMSINARGSIRITNTAQLTQIVSEGTANYLMRLQALNGDVVIEKQANLDSGNILIQSFGGNISITDSKLNAGNAISVRTLSPAGTLTIGGSTISAGRLIQLYADGSNGTVLFTQNVILSGNTEGRGPVVQIAGKTVEVLAGVTVDATGARRVSIFTDNPLFNNGSAFGVVLSSSLSTHPFAARPKAAGSNSFGRPANGNAKPFGVPLKGLHPAG